ncbi:hypothetical protein LCGC14_0851930 [marine sediment metagenome]|uniref:Uncharacterized protein n=1 Tax=marine sediment metagenome TaxID=412755 RepID=A0A0F9RUS5_9ZZZZ
MTELIGDICEPSDLVVPKHEISAAALASISAGYLFLSGLKLWFHDGVDIQVVTSS